MVVMWLVGIVVAIVTFLFGLLPAVQLPAWVGNVSGVVGTVFSFASSMGVWFPTGLVFTVLLSLVAVWAAAFVVRVVRIVLSVFTGGGGS